MCIKQYNPKVSLADVSVRLGLENEVIHKQDDQKDGSVDFKTYLSLVGLKGSNTEMSSSVENVVSKACLRFSGEIQADNFRFCLPYVFINTGFIGFMLQI